MNDLLDFTTMSDPVLAALALNAVGYMLKQSPIDNRWIPMLLTALGLFVYPMLTSWEPRNFVIGLLVGAGSVGLNQLWKQHTNGTTNETKPPTAGNGTSAAGTV